MVSGRTVPIAAFIGLSLSLCAYVALLNTWGALPLLEASWRLPLTSPLDVLAGWMALVLYGCAASFFLRGRPESHRRLASIGALVFALCLIGAQEVAARASVDGWPTFGDSVWREFIAPLYAEHALSLALAFAGMIAINGGAKSKRRETLNPA